MPQKKKILIVEDNPDLAMMYKLAFDGEFEAETANNANEGIAKAETFKPDFVLLDILLGIGLSANQMDGYGVLKKLRTIVPITTIIMINSNLSQQDAEQKALQLGANGFLRKSDFSPFETVEKVKQMLAE